MPILGNFPGGGGAGGGGLVLSAVTDIETMTAHGRVYVKWTDPNDIEIAGAKLATWSGTLLVRKAGSPPISRRDGQIVLDSKERNKYQNEYFCDTGLTDGQIYYYKFFPYTTQGAYTDDTSDEFNATPQPVLVGNVTNMNAVAAGNGKLALTWTDPETTVVKNGITVATWGKTVVTVKAGSYATSPDDVEAAFRQTVMDYNTHVSEPLIANNLTNGETFYVKFFPVTDEGFANTDTANEITGVPNRFVVPDVPSQQGTLTYNGTSQTPEWDNYDQSKMTVSVNGQIDAGTYDATFTLNDDYCWSFEDNAPKVIQWTIDKKKGVLTTEPTSVTLDKDHLNGSFTISGEYDGTVSIDIDAGDNLFTAQLNGLTVDITCNEEQNTGSGTITVKCTEGKNYSAPDDVPVKINTKFVTIYGVQWDGTASTKWDRTDASKDYEDPNPAVGGNGGTSPFDDLMPWAGMTVTNDSAAGSLVRIPKFYFKWTKSGSTLKLQIADGPVEGFYVSPAHMDRGDGKGERNEVFVGQYHCVSGYKSDNGTPLARITRDAARKGIAALGDGIYQFDYAMRVTIQMLYLVEFADWNSQTTIGYGCGNNSAAQAQNTNAFNYHTGTGVAARTTYGVGVKYRNIVGLWDNVYDWMDGCYYNSSGLNVILNPNNFSDTAGGTLVGNMPSSGYPNAMKVGTAVGYEWCLLPETTGGSNTTYVPGNWNFNASSPCLRCGGNYGQGLGRGLFYVSCNAAANSNAGIGCRLQKLP